MAATRTRKIAEQRCLPMPHVPPLLNSVSVLKSVLSYASSCNTCCGNCDEDYFPLIECRKGKFMDSSGKYIQVSYLPQYITCINCIGTTNAAYHDSESLIPILFDPVNVHTLFLRQITDVSNVLSIGKYLMPCFIETSMLVMTLTSVNVITSTK